MNLGRFRFLFRVEVGALFVLTVEGDGGSVGEFFALCVVLDNPPIFFNRNVDVAQFDLSLLFLLDLRQLVPLEGELEAVAAPGVHVGNHPDVFDISRDDLLEGLEGQFLLVSPFSRHFFGRVVGGSSGSWEEDDFFLGDLIDDGVFILVNRSVVLEVELGGEQGHSRLNNFAEGAGLRCEEKCGNCESLHA